MTTINVHDPQQIVIGRIYRNGKGWRRDIEVPNGPRRVL